MRTRLLIALVGIAALAVIAFSVPLAYISSNRIHDGVDVELRRDANRVAIVLPAGFIQRREAPPLPLDDPELRTAVYDAAGLKVAGVGPSQADQLVRSALVGAGGCGSTKADRVCSLPIIEASDVVGAVRASEPRSIAKHKVRRELAEVALGASAVLLVAALAALAGARSLTRPMVALRNAAIRLGAGDYTVEVPLSGVVEMDETARALSQAAKRIGLVVERERAFSADVSHQLRTPITSMRAALETEQLVARPDHALVLEEVLRDVDRLESTVAQLLALARDSPLDRQILPMEEVLDQLDRDWRPRLAKSGRSLRLAVDQSARDVVVWASRSAVEQILDVLLSNAWHHGKGTVSIAAARSTEPSDGLVITVTDEGERIRTDPEELFRRRSSPAGGTGIGLALAASLAQAERGSLVLDNSGRHSIFSLCLAPLSIEQPNSQRADRLGVAE